MENLTAINQNADLIVKAKETEMKKFQKNIKRQEAILGGQKGIQEYVKKIPQCIIDLSQHEENFIGGLPF